MSSGIFQLYEKAQIGISTAFLSSDQQLELLKVLINGKWIELGKHFHQGYYMGEINFKHHVSTPNFEETLCSLICECWETFNSTDKERIKEILKGEE